MNNHNVEPSSIISQSHYLYCPLSKLVRQQILAVVIPLSPVSHGTVTTDAFTRSNVNVYWYYKNSLWTLSLWSGGGEILTAHKRSCRKVMFLQMCVYSQGEVVYCRGLVLTPWIHGILQDTGNKWVMRILLECFLVGENFGHDLPTFRTG